MVLDVINKEDLKIGIDLERQRNNTVIGYALGAEFEIEKTASIRIGYDKRRDLFGISGGIGFNIDIDNNRYKLDYAFKPASELETSTHWIGISAIFGTEVPKKKVTYNDQIEQWKPATKPATKPAAKPGSKPGSKPAAKPRPEPAPAGNPGG